jgi:predicted ATP-binding protein involved in virulence
MFRAIASENFPPFGQVRLEFPAVKDKPDELAEVHLFTGVNGTGKTRLLSVLCAMLGNGNHLAKRMKGAHSSTIFVTDNFSNYTNFQNWSQFTAAMQNSGWNRHVGTFHNWVSQVPAFAYSGNAYIADATITVMGELPRPDRSTCLAFNRFEDSSKLLLQAIANLKVQAGIEIQDSFYLPSDEQQPKTISRSMKIVKALESSVSQITGRRFLFKVENYPKLTISVIWGDTTLSFDVLPDGLRSIIGWLAHALAMMDVWLQGKDNPMETETIFLLDEIESHLHPAWQRKILPAFQRLFPRAQIFVATHSPFVIASLNHGWIHSLKMGQDGKATIEKPIPASKGDSYITVVEEIMGVKEWYDPETEQLLAEFRSARDAAYGGDVLAQEKARQLAMQIGQRSTELDFVMGKELIQMNRQLAKSAQQT